MIKQFGDLIKRVGKVKLIDWMLVRTDGAILAAEVKSKSLLGTSPYSRTIFEVVGLGSETEITSTLATSLFNAGMVVEFAGSDSKLRYSCTWFPQVHHWMVATYRMPAFDASLRQKTILGKMLEDRTVSQIAMEMGIKETTVQTQLGRLREKFEVQTNWGLAAKLSQ